MPPEGTAPTSPPVSGSGDEVTASQWARLLALGVLAVGILLALVLPEDRAKAFKPADGFVVLTGFYVAAQAIERLLELLPGGNGTKQGKADRAVVFSALGFVFAVILAEVVHLYFITAVGTGSLNLNLDVIITALAIGGGTKALHDGIKVIEKAKQTPPATT
jgi:hypothetical protein